MKTNFPPIFFTNLKKMYFSIQFYKCTAFSTKHQKQTQISLNKKILFSLKLLGLIRTE